MIAVIGATGKTGSAVVRSLIDGGQPVRAFVHSEAAKERLPPGVSETAIGDANDVESLKAGLAGAEKAYFSIAASPAMADQVRNMVAAAELVGVRTIVQLSGFRAGPDAGNRMARWLGEMEQAVADSGISYTIVRSATLMQNFFAHAATIKNEGRFAVPGGDMKYIFVDARDIGAVAAVALQEPGHDGQTYFVTGPIQLTYAEAAAILSSELGRKVDYVDVTTWAARDALLDKGMPEAMADALFEMWEDHLVQDMPTATDTVERLLGRAPLSFEQFVRDHKSIFSADKASIDAKAAL